MNEQVLDVKASVSIVRRFWRVIAVSGLVGLLGAAAVDYSAPTRYTASALVLLPVPTGAVTRSSGHGMTTEAQVAKSAAVLVPAARHLHPGLTLTQLEQQVTASSPAASILQVTASASTPSRAETLANAVADEMAAFVSTSGSASSANVIAGLRAQATQLTSQITDVRSQLDAANRRLASDSTATSRRRDGTLVNQLTAQRGNLTLQLNSVKSQIAQAQLQGVATEQGTKVIQRATTATPPSALSLAVTLLMGIVVGLLAGAVVVLAWHRRERRLWSRDALAEAVGAPVLLSLDTSKRREVREWTALLEDYRPSALEEWGVRRALRELSAGGGAGGGVAGSGAPLFLRIVVVAADTAAMSLGVQLAVAAVSSGTRTAFTVVAEDDDAAALRAACSRFDEREPRPGLDLSEGQGEPGQETATGLSVTLAVVRREQAVPAATTGAGTVTALAVSSGFASGEQLAGIAIAAADAGTPVDCLFVANPIASDHTVGRLAASGARTDQRPGRRPLGHRPGTSARAIGDRLAGASRKTPGGANVKVRST